MAESICCRILSACVCRTENPSTAKKTREASLLPTIRRAAAPIRGGLALDRNALVAVAG